MKYSVGIGLTNDCNLSCAHCYRDTTNISYMSLAQIKGIADQCPRDGGWAVYAARSIYAAFEPEAFWDINEGCGRALKPSSVKTPAEISSQFVVMPNPVSEFLTVTASKSSDQLLTFELSDVSGRVLKKTQIEAGSISTSVDVGRVPAGLYYYKITKQGEPLQSGKIAIVR